MAAVSVTAPMGFRAAGVAAGIKKNGTLDLALVAAGAPVPAAAVFTRHAAAAAPVNVSRRHLATSRTARVVVLNSGCANAGTGARGEADALAVAQAAADVTSSRIEDVLVCSTGAIGPPLPVDLVTSGVHAAAHALSSEPADAGRAATAILTTDNRPKEVIVPGEGYVVGGMAKGAGMVRPDMATMLAVLTTDAAASPEDLHASLAEATDASFHSLNLDGCASTNDAVIVLASGASGVVPAKEQLTAGLTAACRSLATQMAADVEGGGRVVTIDVIGARDDDTARALGRAAADSALVRAAFYGGDPNWGRVFGAMGASGLPFDVEAFALAYQGVTVASGGVEADYDRAALAAVMGEDPLGVEVRVGRGPGTASILTVDLTPEYVLFNAEYS